jgi:hypothetical protein
MLSFSMNELGLLLSKSHLGLNSEVVWYVVETMLTQIHQIFINVPRVMAKLVHFGL